MGFGAGVTRRGQVHSEVVALSGEYVALSGQDVPLHRSLCLAQLNYMCGGSHPPWESSS